MAKIEQEISEIKEEIEGIKNLLEEMNKKLDKINSTVEIEVKGPCAKMSDHIDFVEVVYNNIKAPLSYLCGKVKYLKNSDTEVDLLDNKQGESPEERLYHLIDN